VGGFPITLAVPETGREGDYPNIGNYIGGVKATASNRQ
jgi:hypothetical protein